jgi:hypothetical protein
VNVDSTAEKVCPQCHCEYLAVAENCADCDTALVHPSELGKTAQVAALPPAAEMIPLRIATTSFIEALSGMLSEAGISHRVDAAPDADSEADGGNESRARRQSHDVGVAIYILEEDVERALAVDAEFIRQQIPDQPEQDAAHDDETCPACGDPCPPDAAECPGCGLPFLEMD